jgi:hypothetical protein
LDLNRIVRMLVGMFAFKALRGLSRKVGGTGPARSGPASRTGGGAAKPGTRSPGAPGGAKAPATPQEAQARAAREAAKRARKAAQLTRRLGR